MKVLNILVLIVAIFAIIVQIVGAASTSKSGVVHLTSKDFDKLVLQSDAPWIVAFIAPWCGHCKRLHPEYEKAAASLGGVVNVGQVDCEAEKALAQRFRIEGFPTIKFFPAYKDKKKNPIPYESARTAQAIAEFALRQLPSNVATMVTTSNLDKFLEGDLPKAILFTNKDKIPPLMHSLGLELNKRMKIGVVKSTETALTEKFNVDSFPKVLVIPAGDADATPIPYEGGLKKAELLSFLESHAVAKEEDSKKKDKRNNNNQASNKDSEKKMKEKEEEQKKPEEKPAPAAEANSITEIPELDVSKVQKICKKTCVIAVVPTPENKEKDLEVILALANLYKRDESMKFVWVDASNNADFIQTLGVSMEDNKPGLAVLRVKKSRVSVMDKATHEWSLDSLEIFLGRIVGGDAAWKKIDLAGGSSSSDNATTSTVSASSTTTESTASSETETHRDEL